MVPERLAKEDRFEFFPAASLGWVLSGEQFWEPIADYVDYFKIRGSYGLVGSDQFNSGAQHYQNHGSYWEQFLAFGTSGQWLNRQGHGFAILAVQKCRMGTCGKKLDIGLSTLRF
ncbi:MAG: hypothetical protein ACLR6J_11660 [Parabacteroides merdae]